MPPPLADVNMLLSAGYGVSLNDNASVTLSSSLLLFTTENWHIDQTVVVTALDDADSFYAPITIILAIAAESTPLFDDVSMTLALAIIDDELPQLDIALAALSGLNMWASYSFYGDSSSSYVLATTETVDISAIVNNPNYNGGDLYYIPIAGATARLVQTIAPRAVAPDTIVVDATSTMARVLGITTAMEYHLASSPIVVDVATVFLPVVAGQREFDLSTQTIVFRYKATADKLASLSSSPTPSQLHLGFDITEEVHVEGNRSVAVVVSLATVFDEDVYFSYVVSGSATIGEDYRIESATTLRLASGELSQTINITLLDDSEREGSEDIVIVLNDPGSVSLFAATYRLRIEDNDSDTVLPEVVNVSELVETDVKRDRSGRGWYLDQATGYVYEAAVTPLIGLINASTVTLSAAGDKSYDVVSVSSPATIVDIVTIPQLEVALNYSNNEGYPYVYIDIDGGGDLTNTIVWDPQGQRIISLDARILHVEAGGSSVTRTFDGRIGERVLSSGLSLPTFSVQPNVIAESLQASKLYRLYGYADGIFQEVATGVSSGDGVIDAWRYSNNLDIGDNLLLLEGSLSLPVPVNVAAPFRLSAEVNKRRVSVGDILTYKVTVENISSVTATYSYIRVLDEAPRGFKYVRGSGRYQAGATASISQLAIDSESSGGSGALTFRISGPGSEMMSGEVRYLYYQLLVGTGIGVGDHHHMMRVTKPREASNTFDSANTTLSNVVRLKIEVVEDALFDLGTIIGKVFNDINGNGIQDEGEQPVSFARIHTDKGYIITTDENGRYHLANMSVGRHALKLDMSSLPRGARLVSRKVQIADITAGLPVKVNFAVDLSQEAISKEVVGARSDLFTLFRVRDDVAPYLNVSLYKRSRSGDVRRLEDNLEFRVFTNYPLHISRWRLQIRDELDGNGGSIVKVLRGTRETMLEAILWDGVLSNGNMVQADKVYSYQLSVEDDKGNIDSTIARGFGQVSGITGKGFVLEKPSKLESPRPISAISDTNADVKTIKRGQPISDGYYRNAWVERESFRDNTAKRRISPRGSKVRIVGGGYEAIRILRRGQEVLSLPVVRSLEGSHVRDQHRLEIILPLDKYQFKAKGWFKKGKSKNSDNKGKKKGEEHSLNMLQWMGERLVGLLTWLVSSADAAEDELTRDLTGILTASEGSDISDFDFDRLLEALSEEGSGLEVAATRGVVLSEAEGELVEQPRLLEGSVAVQSEVSDELEAAFLAETVVRDLSYVESEAELDLLRPLEELTEAQSGSDFVLVALADFEFGDNKVDGIVSQLRQGYDGEQYESGLWKRGKLSYFLHGTIRGDYFVSSSYDSERGRDDLFNQLDPDKEYAVYGDGSTVDKSGVNTRGKFYLLIEKDELSVKWGNFTTDLKDSELIKFERNLHGGKVHYESVSRTKYGRPSIKVVAFHSRAYELSARNELLVTGGSLYYLRHEDLVAGSLSVSLQRRDDLNGNVVSSVDLIEGEDYEIDYGRGKLTLNKVLVSQGGSRFIITGDLAREDKKYLLVSYAYEGSGDVDEVVQGLRLEKSLGELGSIGLTAVEENLLTEKHELSGVDVNIKGERGYLRAEHGKSKETSVNRIYYSDDGGLSYRDGEPLSLSDGKATKIRGRVNLLSGDRIKLSAYHRDIESGYSSLLVDAMRGEEASGIDVIFHPMSDTHVRLAYDDVERERLATQGTATASYMEGDVIGKETSEVLSLQLGWRRDDLGLTLEYRKREDEERNELSLDKEEEEEALAVRADYRFSDDISGYVQYQGDLTDGGDDRMSLGVNAKLNRYVTLNLSGTELEGEKFTALATLIGSRAYELAPGVVLRGQASLSTDGEIDYGLDGGFNRRVRSETGLSFGGDVSAGISDEGDYDNRAQFGLGLDYALNENVQLTLDGGAAGELVGVSDYDGDVRVGVVGGYDLSDGREVNFKVSQRRDIGGKDKDIHVASLSGSQALGGGYALQASAEVLSGNSGTKSDRRLELKKATTGRQLSFGLVDYEDKTTGIKRGNRLLFKDDYGLGKLWRLKTGIEYDVNANERSERQRTRRSGVKLDYLAERLSGGLNVEQSYVVGYDGLEIKRQIAALDLGYREVDEQTEEIDFDTSLKLEYRSDRGEGNADDLDQYRAKGYARGNLGGDWTLQSKVSYDKVENKASGIDERDELRLDVGFAYRPIKNDWLNLFGQISAIENNRTPSGEANQIDIYNLSEEKALVFALDMIFEDEQFILTEKLAYRVGEERVLNLPLTESEYWLWINKLGYKLDRDTRLSLEYRILRHKQARDSRKGVVLSLSKRMNDNFELEAGYRFVDLNDDLADLDFSVKGVYVRLTGVLGH